MWMKMEMMEMKMNEDIWLLYGLIYDPTGSYLNEVVTGSMIDIRQAQSTG